MRKRIVILSLLIPFLVSGCLSQRGPSYDPWIYSGDLRKRIASATRLRVRSGGTNYHPELREENTRTLFETSDPNELTRLRAKLEFTDEQDGDACFCSGAPTLEWYKGKTLLATVSLQHGTAMRWVKHWPGDARLISTSADWLVNWLAQHGVTEPKREREIERTAAANQKLNRTQ